MSSPASDGNVVTLTYTIKIGLVKQHFWIAPDFGYFLSFLDETIRDMQFVVNTAPSSLIPMLDAIDKHMLDRENRNHFEIIRLQADSPNCTFST